MRRTSTSNGLTALAVAGTNVVAIGWDMSAAQIRDQKVLGFSVGRKRASDSEFLWLGGFKTFEAVEPEPPPGVPVSSYRHPLQTFQWCDYSVAPGETYSYRLVARCGTPESLTDGAEVELGVTTESVEIGKHAVFFNRGAVASQEYARRFQNRRPDEVGQPAFDWLSRGLVEGLERFIQGARQGSELYGAFFEFKSTRILRAVEAAVARGARVRVLYDGDSQREANEDAIAQSTLGGVCTARERSGRYAHNKFLILVENGVARAVWTGSTNLSQNGIFGHSNNAHIVRDERIAGAYLRYWQIIEKDLPRSQTAAQVEALGEIPPPAWQDGMLAVFSPRQDLAVLDWYAKLAHEASRAVFTTFAFGMNERFERAYDQEGDVLRYALMEKKGTGVNFKKQAEAIDRIRRHRNTVIAVGNRVELNAFDRWLEETARTADDQHVLYVHTKYMLVDPLGATPILVMGSANFSNASTDTNDENMLVIRGDQTLADIYLGEFMRLFTHYAFRESLRFKNAMSPTNAMRRKHLVASTDWIMGERPGIGYFDKGSNRALRRLYFSGK